MKKTIAKIMAAAMVLSAVPAVALPTMTAEAAASVTASQVSSVTKDADGDVVVEDNGDTGINVGTGVKVTAQAGSLAAPTTANTATDAVYVAFTTSDTAVSGTTNTLEDVLSFSVSNSGHLVMSVDKSVNDWAKIALNAIKTGKNDVTIRLYSDAYGTTSGQVGTLAYSTTSSYYQAVRYFGGKADSTGTIKANVDAEEGTLNSGDIYVKLDSTTKAEVEVLKGANDDLDDNDALRGQMLNLNHVTVGGFEYTVVKIGAQALKKAHMKKIKAENVKRIGKGALRKAKQLKHADFQDSNKIRKINGKAFYDCKNLKTIIIDGRKLKTVGKDAFHGVKKNCTVKIKAKKSKFESDKKMILKNGGNKNLKFVRK